VTGAALNPRKSPRQSRARATVETIIEAAARILETVGPEGFNTNAVAASAGVSVGSLYQYFPSKQALIAELSRRNAEAVLDGLAEVSAATAGKPLEARLAAFVRFAIDQQCARPKLSRVLDQLEEGLDLTTDAAATTPDILAVLAPVLAADAPPTDPADVLAIASDCLALVRALIDAALDRGPVDQAGLERNTIGALLGYLGASLKAPERAAAHV